MSQRGPCGRWTPRWSTSSGQAEFRIAFDRRAAGLQRHRLRSGRRWRGAGASFGLVFSLSLDTWWNVQPWVVADQVVAGRVHRSAAVRAGRRRGGVPGEDRRLERHGDRADHDEPAAAFAGLVLRDRRVDDRERVGVRLDPAAGGERGRRVGVHRVAGDRRVLDAVGRRAADELQPAAVGRGGVRAGRGGVGGVPAHGRRAHGEPVRRDHDPAAGGRGVVRARRRGRLVPAPRSTGRG